MADAPIIEAAKPPQPPGAFRRKDWLFALALLAVTLAAYYPAWSGKALWDDDAHITSRQLRSWAGLVSIWFEPGATQQYYPLVHSVFWVEHKIWGDSTLGYHLINIVLHVFCAVLLLRILRMLEMPGAWLAAAIFALHPVEVESVAWISELKNTLSGVFYLGAALVYLRFDRTREWRLYGIALGLFFLGLFCKTVIATLPAALLVIFWWQRGKLSWKKDAKPLIPFFVLGIAMGLFTAAVEKNLIIGNEITSFHFTLIERFLIAGRAFWFYTGKLLWPANLIFIYPRWDVSQGIWWQYLFPVAAVALLAGLWMLRKRTRSPLAAALFFGGTLFPALGFVNVYPFIYSFVADHFQYLAGIGIITLGSAGAAKFSQRLRGWQKHGASLLAGAVLLLLAALTWRQCGIYADTWILFTTTIKQNPECWMACNNLGDVLLQNGRYDEAIDEFRQALKLKSDYAKPESNMGLAYYQKGNIPEAISHFQKALEIRPDLPEAHNNLANILFQTGNVDQAMVHYQKALKIDPKYTAARIGLGNIYYQKGDMEDALGAYRKALETRSDMAEIETNIGNVFAQSGRFDEALSHFQKALKIQPDYLGALNNLAWLLSTTDSSVRDGQKAVAFAVKANALAGGKDPGVLATLAAAYAETGHFPEAIAAVSQARNLAVSANNTGLVNVLNTQLKFYQAGKPIHQTSR